MGVQQLRTLIQDMAMPSKVLDREELRTLEKLTVVSWDFLQHKACRLVAGAHNRPILASFGSDGTSLMSRHHYSFELGGLRLSQTVRSTEEFLVQKCFLTHRGVLLGAQHGRPVQATGSSAQGQESPAPVPAMQRLLPACPVSWPHRALHLTLRVRQGSGQRSVVTDAAASGAALQAAGRE